MLLALALAKINTFLLTTFIYSLETVKPHHMNSGKKKQRNTKERQRTETHAHTHLPKIEMKRLAWQRTNKLKRIRVSLTHWFDTINPHIHTYIHCIYELNIFSMCSIALHPPSATIIIRLHFSYEEYFKSGFYTLFATTQKKTRKKNLFHLVENQNGAKIQSEHAHNDFYIQIIS